MDGWLKVLHSVALSYSTQVPYLQVKEGKQEQQDVSQWEQEVQQEQECC